MALLEATAVSAPVLTDKKAKDKEKDGTGGDIFGTLEENPDLTISSDNALIPSTSLLDVTGLPEDTDTDSGEMNIYVVRKNDSLSQIAEMFDVSTNTILWANDLKKGQKIAEGDILFILPVSGVKHTVAKGETLKSIAKKYKVDADVITAFNGLPFDSKLALGEELIIPDAEMPNDDAPAPKKKTNTNYYASGSLKNLSGYFINPVPGLKRRSQNLHGPGNRGIDLAAATGTTIYASAPGRVLLARTGYNGGYGNMAIIEHSNGTKTLYAHMVRLGTKTGAQVERGEVIGYVGSTGRSTGPHLHFEVFNAKNPGTDWSWAN